MKCTLKDVQNQVDTREIALKKAGIKGLHYPITVLDKINGIQHTSATADLSVNLPRNFKGTHMSRFIEVFHLHYKSISMKEYLHMLREIRQRLNAAHAYGEIRFPYFIEKRAPVSNQAGVMRYICAFDGFVSENKTDDYFDVCVEVPIQTVCPCSKEISEYGAHNQRGVVRIRLRIGAFFWIEDLIALVESCASAPLYSLLKREDEKYVTEQGYDNPKFVEDVVRDVCRAIPALGDFPQCTVEAENDESIHNHNAFASAEGYCKDGVFVQT